MNDLNKVSLSKARKEDALCIYSFYMEDKEELKDIFNFVNDDLTVSHEEKFFSNPGDNYPFVIKYNDKVCGFALLYDLNSDNKNVSALYYVNSKYRGFGIASLATLELLDFAFTNLNVDRVNFYINTDNYGSLKVVSGLELNFDKFLPNFDFVNGKYHDQKLYFICKDEFLNMKQR